MKRLTIATILAVMMVMLAAQPACASNATVSSVSITNVNSTAGTADINFTLSQDNTFSGTDANFKDFFDRVWIFVKFWDSTWTEGATAWGHATLTTGGTLGTYSSTTGIGITSDGKGAFAKPGAGQTLRWQFTDDGISATDTVTVKVMAIEMVYIPEGSFYIGDGTSNGTLRQTGSNTPVEITTTGVVVKCEDTPTDDTQLEGDGILIDGDGGIDKDGAIAVDNANFPTGYGAFYIMKYEVSQGQYADFLNTLTTTQATARYPNKSDYRHTITVSSGTYSASAPCRACNYLSWMDLAAYADWAGLRPITELEYEKACRGGGVSVVAGEYAWGNTSIHNAAYSITNDGGVNATITSQPTSTGNCSYSTTDGDLDGPLRCGIFAQSGTSRQEAGASYYGVMELSGNLWERPVTVGNETGRSFEGTHGDGDLTSGGYADNSDWPGYVTDKVSGATGSGLRVGGWSSGSGNARVSDRYFAAWGYTDRVNYYGGRCARTE